MLAIVPLLALAAPLAAGPRDVTFPSRPSKGDRIVDEAGLIGVRERAAIREVCDQLQRDLRLPLRVVTLRSLADYGAEGWDLERYAVDLFDEWALESTGLGPEVVDWGRGILILVSVLDAQVHVELGDEWLGHHRALSRRVVRELVVPELEAGRPSQALLLATLGLDAIAREGELPPMRTSLRGLAWKTLTGAALLVTVFAAVRGRGLGRALALWRSWLWAPFDGLDRRAQLDLGSEAGGPLAESSGSSGSW